MTKPKKAVKAKSATAAQEPTSTIAKSDDGTVQINFSIPYSYIENAQSGVIDDLSAEITVPGFRKGKAPRAKVKESIPENTLVEKTVSKIVPNLFTEAIQLNNLRPATYPKLELISAKEGETWQVRATTCELPNVKLGDYKKKIAGASKASAIWTPEKGDKDEKEKEPTKEEKEQVAIRALIESVDLTIPKVLVEEEVNARLSALLEKIEKLGLNLDGYLASIGKSADQLRTEYEIQAIDSIKLEIVLNKIAAEEKVVPDEAEVKRLLDLTKTHKHEDGTQHEITKTELAEQKRLIELSLKKRAALDYVISLM